MVRPIMTQQCVIINKKEVLMYNEIFFDDARDFYDGYACVKLGHKWGVINTQGELALEYSYDELHHISENIYAAKLNNKYGLIDRDRNIILDFQYDSLWLSDFHNGTFQAELNNKFGIIDKNNNIIFDFKYERFQLANYDENQKYIVAYLDGKCGVLDTNENIILPFEYKKHIVNKNEYFIVSKYGLWGVVDINLDVIIPIRYESLSFWSDDNFCAKTENGKWILINNNDEKICETEFDYICTIFEDENKLHPAMIDWKNGFIDKNGIIRIGLNYEEVSWFDKGLAAVCLNDKWGLIDENENLIIPFEYDSQFFSTEDELITALKDGKWGVIDYKNNIIADFIYGDGESFLLSFYKDYAIVKLDNKYGYIDKKGQRLKFDKTICLYQNRTQNQRGL